MLLSCLSQPRLSSSFVSLLVLALFSFLKPIISYGAEWTLKGTVNQSLGYDDNVNMLPTNPQGSFKYMILPVLSFAHKTDTTEINANAVYGTQIYTEIPELDQDIQSYGLSGIYKTERIDWGLSANFAVTPTRNTAVQNSGVFDNNSESNTWTVSPTVNYKIDAINSLLLSSSYSETTFNTSGSSVILGDTVFVNNTTYNVNLGWQRLWTDQYSSTLSWFYSNFEPQPKASGSTLPSQVEQNDSVGLNFSNAYKWSENWDLQGTVGVRHTETTSNNTSNSSFGFLADVGIKYAGERLNSGIYANRSLVPSNQGQLQELSSVTLALSYKIMERLSTGFTVSYQDSSFVNGQDTTSDSASRTNIVFEPTISWQFTPELAVSGSYRFRSQEGGLQNDNGGSASADSNLFLLSINYNWQGLSLSK